MNPEDIGQDALDRGEDTGIEGAAHLGIDNPEAQE